MRAIVYALLLLPAASLANEGSNFVASLNGRYAEYHWDATRVIAVDLNRDGAIDRVALGLRKNSVAFLVQLGGIDAPLIEEVPIDGSQQFGICPGDDLQISLRKQSEAPTEALGENPSGYEICPTCFEVVVGGGDCDPLHFYWDVTAKQLGWWRA